MSAGLDPAGWGTREISALTVQARRGPKQAGRGTRHVVSTEHPLSTRAAVATLRSGGTAADALVAAAILQTVIMPGTVTLAGTMGGLYFDPRAGRSHAFNAGFDVPVAETGDYDHRRDLTTGRSVLVPGMLAGLYELHQRFGRLAWSDLLRPAIHFAMEGFEVGPEYAALLEHRRTDLLRRPAGRAIFAQDGDLPRVGSILRQPQLGSTLEAIALDGPDHLYRGAWASDAVETVVAAGGRLSVEDLARYCVRWPEPIRGTFLDTEFVTVPPPHWGGALTLLMLKVAEAARLHELQPTFTDAGSLGLALAVYRSASASGRSLAIDLESAGVETVQRFYETLSSDECRRIATALSGQELRVSTPGANSHHIAAIDADGGMVTATHTVLSNYWGSAGLFVSGVSLNGAAYMRALGAAPGGRVCEPLAPYMIFRESGRSPYLAAGAIGNGLVCANFQNTMNVIAHGLSLSESIAAPRFGSLGIHLRTMVPGDLQLVEGFPPQVLEAMESGGVRFLRRGPQDPLIPQGDLLIDSGYWTAVAIDDGQLVAVSDPRHLGIGAGD